MTEATSVNDMNYTDVEGKQGVLPLLYKNGNSLEQVYQESLVLASKIDRKWRKKRLLQIGMFEDMLGILNIAAGYNSALKAQLNQLSKPIVKEPVVKVEQYETDLPPGPTEGAAA